jgi:hypothetical protein
MFPSKSFLAFNSLFAFCFGINLKFGTNLAKLQSLFRIGIIPQIWVYASETCRFAVGGKQ